MFAVGYVACRQQRQTALRSHPEFLRQRAAMQSFSRRSGIRIRAIPADDLSAASLKLIDRQGLIKALGLMQEKGYTVLVVSDLDSVGFSRLEKAVLLLRLSRSKIRVLEANSGRELTADVTEWESIAADHGAVERRDVERSMTALKKRSTHFANGTRAGRKGYGHWPEEEVILERIWRLRRKPPKGKRMSYQAIAQVLNAEGVKPRRGKSWYAATVQMIVRRKKPHLDRE